MSKFNISHIKENPNFVEQEKTILQYWKEIDAFKLSNKISQNKNHYIFYDGPPFATGLPHYGHILAGIVKDCVTRYYYQCNHYVERRFGWDCHGLPIEYEVEKENNINKKQDVLDMGINVYNEKCRSIVLKYCKEWIYIIQRIGRWIDFVNDYKTMDKSFMESVWWVFKELYKKNYVYKSFKVMPYSCKCNTPISNFELNLNYKDTSDPSIIVGFQLLSCLDNIQNEYIKIKENENTINNFEKYENFYKNLSDNNTNIKLNETLNIKNLNCDILAWTTTPWTLPSNLALCINENFIYLRILNIELNKIIIVAECRLEWVLKEIKWNINNLHLLNRFKGKYLKNLKYQPIFDYFLNKCNYKDNAYKILTDDFVSDDTGTGIVHCAPCYGEDDFRVCKENNVIDIEKGYLLDPLDSNGYFTDEIKDLEKLYIKDADNVIKNKLKANNRLYSNNSIVHSYPFCWRSDTPLIYRAIPAWFIKVNIFTEKLLKNNETTRWIPNHIKEKKFHNWIKFAKDWCISRNRYWGTPIPIWTDEKHENIICIGSIEELEQLSGVKNIQDLHRHYIDKIEIDNPSGKHLPKLKRIPEVFDCWFESGSMPFAKEHYPFSKNYEDLKNIFPADFIAEGIDQTRGWFYTLLVISTLLYDKAPFKNLICNGLILASDGKKMSKRLKNYPDPLYIVDKYGADSLRLYLINSVAVRAESLKFQEKGVNEIVKNFLLPYYHSFRFLCQELTRFKIVHKEDFVFYEKNVFENDNIMDQWLFSNIQNLIKCVHDEMQTYKLYNVLPNLLNFIENLTNWYIRLNRDRMRGSLGKQNAIHSLSIVYRTITLFTILMSPFTPFISEYIYLHLININTEKPIWCDNMKENNNYEEIKKSVHFIMLPLVEKKYEIKYEIIELIENMKNVIVLGRILREKRKTPNKTPLKSMTIIHTDKNFFKDFDKISNYIKDELNILNIEYSNDISCLNFIAIPNYKKLGAKLGKNLKNIQDKIRCMTSEQIKEYEQNNKIIIDDVLLENDDIIIQMNHKSNDKNTETISNNFITVLIDFTMDKQLENMAYARELCNHIQKMRKTLSLNQNDPLLINAYIYDALLKDNMIKELNYINKCLRKQLNILNTEHEIDNLLNKIHKEVIVVNEKNILIVLCKE